MKEKQAMSVENSELGLEGESPSLELRQEVMIPMVSHWMKPWEQNKLFSVKWIQLQIQKKCEKESQSEPLTNVIKL